METGGKDAVVKPWVWILWLLLGPALHSVVTDWYFFRTVSNIVFNHVWELSAQRMHRQESTLKLKLSSHKSSSTMPYACASNLMHLLRIVEKAPPPQRQTPLRWLSQAVVMPLPLLLPPRTFNLPNPKTITLGQLPVPKSPCQAMWSEDSTIWLRRTWLL